MLRAFLLICGVMAALLVDLVIVICDLLLNVVVALDTHVRLIHKTETSTCTTVPIAEVLKRDHKAVVSFRRHR